MGDRNQGSHSLAIVSVEYPPRQEELLTLRREMVSYIARQLEERRRQIPRLWSENIDYFARKVEYALAKNAITKQLYEDKKSLGSRVLAAAKLVLAENYSGIDQGVPTSSQGHASTFIPTPGMSPPSLQAFQVDLRHDQEEEQRKQNPLRILQTEEELGSSSGIIASTSDSDFPYDVKFSSLHSNFFGKVVSAIPMETLFELSSVSKNWETRILHDYHYIQPPIQPSARNGPIAVVVESNGVSIKTYNGKLKVWLDQDMGYFLKHDFYSKYSSGDFSAAGSLLFRYHREFHRYRRVVNVIDICNPITKQYRRLQVPLTDAVHEDRIGQYRKAMVLGVLVEKQRDRYKLLVQRELSVRNDDGSESKINHIMVYNSAHCLWENGGTLSPGIVARVGRGVYCSTSSGGNLYFLTTDFQAANFDWREPRLLKYDPHSRKCTEISPLPGYVGRWAGPMILEHRGEILFMTRDARYRSRYENPCYEWVFFRLQEQNAYIWEKIKEMPEDVADALTKKVTTVRCHGNGDLVYFYGPGKKDRRTQRTQRTQPTSLGVRVLVHDLVANSWVWLTDISTKDNQFDRLDLLSIEPSFTKV